MQLTWLDYGVIAAYFALMVAIAFLWKSKASENIAQFFISGRSIPWWLAGTSMVATTFAADTPLAVTGLVVKYGLAGNWFWWSMALGGMFTAFVFARYWRRAEVFTDVELVELRYGGKPAAFLRAFRAVYLVFLINPIVMGWVTSAMLKVVNYGFGHAEVRVSSTAADTLGGGGDWWLIVGLLAAVGLYSVAAGMWGVVITDFVQFVLAMFGCIALALLAVAHVGGMTSLREAVLRQYGSDQPLRFLPDFGATDPWMPISSFAIMLGIQWWASWYPGAEPGGGGFVVQRMAACQDERHARAATVWFKIAHYCLRPWPWLLVALVALLLFPDLRNHSNPDLGYVLVMRELSPAGLRGLLLVTFFAAYMSTISTLVNWGSSYLVRDLYQRYLRPQAQQHELVQVARVASLIVLLSGAVAAWFMRHTSVDTAWKLLAALGAGTGLVYMLRWFWWRINAWTEIAAMVCSFLGYLLLTNLPHGSAWREEHLLAANALLTIGGWLTIMWLTPPERQDVLIGFYRRVRPDGPGWKCVASRVPDCPADRTLGRSVIAAFLGAGLVYGVLWTVGLLLFRRWSEALIGSLFSAGCAFGMYYWGIAEPPRRASAH